MSVATYEVGRTPGPPTRERVDVDPITMRVIGGAFHAIAKEMAGVLFRMSYSSIIRESEDLGAGIFDAEGNELCESDSTPMFMGRDAEDTSSGFMDRLGDDIHDGDVILHNDPYLGASHSPDVAIVVPIFHEGELVGFAARHRRTCSTSAAPSRASTPTPSTTTPEGKLYNALRWYREGELNVDVDRMLFDNIRTPTMNRGDMKAMIAACELGRDRFLRLRRALRRRDGHELGLRLDGLLRADAAPGDREDARRRVRAPTRVARRRRAQPRRAAAGGGEGDRRRATRSRST